MSAPKKAMRRRAMPDNALSIYRGRDMCGWISLSGREWLAFDDDGLLLGEFASRLQAAAAVLRDRGAP